MRRTGIAGICLLAMLVAGMIAAGGASAAPPEFKICAKAEPKNTGEYTGKGCGSTEKAGTPKTGKYEIVSWEKAKKKTFKGKGGLTKFLIINPTEEGKVESELECQSEKTAGEVTGPQTEKWTTTYKKCEVHALKGEIVGPCATEGAKKDNEITTEEEGTLVFLNAAKTSVGMRVKAQGGSYKKISCIEGLVNDTPSGEFIVQRTQDANFASKSFEAIAKEGAKHGQDPYYEEEAHSEEEAFNTFNFPGCVEKEVKEGHSEAEADFICEGKLGEPHPPISRIAHISGAKSATAPETVVGVTVDKGEAFLVET